MVPQKIISSCSIIKRSSSNLPDPKRTNSEDLEGFDPVSSFEMDSTDGATKNYFQVKHN